MPQKLALVLGANGQLGQEIKAISDQYDDLTFYFASREEINIVADDLSSILDYHLPSIVINCAAYTAVDKAEKDVHTAESVNATALRGIAQACRNAHAPLIHISSDYVYHIAKKGPLLETDFVNPQGIYAKTKWQGESIVREQWDKHIILRTSWLYSRYGHNFVNTMLRIGKEKNDLKIVSDQLGSPTYAQDLAHAICHIATKVINNIDNMDQYGTYNYANEGIVSWYDFAKTIFQIKGISTQVIPITTKAYNAPAPRPLWSVMSKNKIKNAFDLSIPHWRESLVRMLGSTED